MTVGQLLRSITAQELAEWAAYFKLENERVEERSGRKPRKVNNPKAAMQAMFGHRVVKGKKGK